MPSEKMVDSYMGYLKGYLCDLLKDTTSPNASLANSHARQHLNLNHVD
jgi:hypothetical protein